MSVQEAALYGDLVLYLRDQAADLLAGEDSDREEQQEHLDHIIRDWFFTPQDRLHGCAPRELIWAEQGRVPNPIHPEHLDEFFVGDCPICQAELEEIKAAMEADEDPGWHWYYDDGGYPLIARYDPEGWDECWAEIEADVEAWQTDQGDTPSETSLPAAEAYEPFPVTSDKATPEAFMARLRQPWIDPRLHQAAQMLAERLDCPEPSEFGLQYRRIRYEEALSLLVGLYEHGVDVEGLLSQIEAFPYQYIALDWLSQPAENAAWLVEMIEREAAQGGESDIDRMRHHRDFIFMLSRMVSPGAQLWLRGWLDAIAHGAITRAIEDDEQPSRPGNDRPEHID